MTVSGTSTGSSVVSNGSPWVCRARCLSYVLMSTAVQPHHIPRRKTVVCPFSLFCLLLVEMALFVGREHSNSYCSFASSLMAGNLCLLASSFECHMGCRLGAIPFPFMSRSSETFVQRFPRHEPIGLLDKVKENECFPPTTFFLFCSHRSLDGIAMHVQVASRWANLLAGITKRFFRIF